MKVLGIDPGTSRWAFVFLEDGELAEEKTIPTQQVKSDPRVVLNLAEKAGLVVAPSGYGAPLKKVSGLDEADFKDILLKREEDSVMGLEQVLRLFKENSLNAYMIPGVKLLPTVPETRKKNKIDMGTPDKLCVAVAGIVDQARRLGLHYKETSFVLAEIGYGFDAFLLVSGGQIVNGIGGTMSSSTWKGEDGEILYLKGEATKEELRKDISPEKVRECAQKDISKLLGEHEAREILVSGSQAEQVFDFLKQNFRDVVRLRTCNSSNAAYGAAILADGLAGGRFKELVDHLRLKKATGSNLSYTTL